jgi:hypothetical protein
MMFISLLVPKNAFFTDIGHFPFSLLTVCFQAYKKGRKHHARAPLHHDEGRPVQDGPFDMVLLFLLPCLEPLMMFLAFLET